MTWEVAIDPLVAVAIASVRVMALLLTAPLFGDLSVPLRMRAGLAIMLAWAIGPSADALGWRGWESAELISVVAIEALLGAALGFASRILFVGFTLMGDFISTQGGLGAARVIDPSTGASSVALAQVFNMSALLVFVAIDGHHELIRSLGISFDRLPTAGFGLEAEAFSAIASLGATIFDVAVRLAAPITVAMFVQNVAMGVLAKSMPQLNLMMVQLPAHIMMLLGMVLVGATAFVEAMSSYLHAWPSVVLGAILGGS